MTSVKDAIIDILHYPAVFLCEKNIPKAVAMGEETPANKGFFVK